VRRRVRRAAAGAVAAALLAAGAVAFAVTRDDGTDPAPAADSADAGFARDMAVHHQQGVELAYLVRDRTDDEEVRRLAYDIAQTQANQRGMLLGWLDLWELPKVSSDPPMTWMGMGDMPSAGPGSLMPGMATDAELAKLGTLDGRRAEVYFLRLMTEHHKGGAHMAEGCVERCAVKAEKRLADSMVESQRSEIALMADLLRERGAKPPA
jgi:uncharacterized protein (DUF305 family)